MQTRSLPTKAPLEAATFVMAGEPAGIHEEHRAHARQSIECCRPIAVRCLDAEGKPSGRWFLADIMDLSEGGMCLLTSGDPAPELGQWLLLDLRAHPNFGRTRMRAKLRWYVRAHFALTFGVAFASPLRDVPTLAVERRSVRRDPNLEEWALSED